MRKPRFGFLAVAFAAVLVVVTPLSASNPPENALAVPTAVGASVSATWTGTMLPGANATSDCSSLPRELSDAHAVTFTVPAGLYDGLTAVFTFQIEWGNADSDEILTVLGPEGEVIGSSDGGSPVEVVVRENLDGGTYTVLACAFAAATPEPYTGRVEVRTEAPTAAVSAPADGLAFSASVATDNQRDESEPLVEIDRAGNIYSCGPTGSSQAAEYAHVSTDGGESFHLLGTPPRGQMSAGGGGDCALATGLVKNERGFYDLAYTGLGPLTGFSTSISPNNGRSLATAGFEFTGGVTNRGAVADRQWEVFVDANTVLLTYNQQQPRNAVVLRSTDKGLTFDVANAAVAAASPGFPGPIRYDEKNDLAYMSWDDTGTLNGRAGSYINLSVSRDKGRTWTFCNADFVEGETTLFSSADHDSAGNIYVAYGSTKSFHTYVTVLPQAATAKCLTPTSLTAERGSNPGFLPRIQMDRDAVRSTVFPWVTAGGAPGRAAVAFLGTETDGDPNLGTFDAAWDVYVSMVTDALTTPVVRQVKATTHPIHYDSICLNGLGCDLSVPPGDRSMADFFAVDYNPVTDKLTVVFDRTNKKPEEAAGHVATTMAVTQNGGPTLGGATLTPVKPVVRTSDVDPAGDALSSYSHLAPLVVPPDPLTANEAAADFRSISVGHEVDLVDGKPIKDGGFTVTMKVADLSAAALQATLARTGSQSLLWVFRFTNGYQDVAAAARWNPVHGFTFGYNDYTTGGTPCVGVAGASSDKCLVYPGDTPILGAVDQATGTIRLNVPRYLLRALSGPTGHRQRPAEVPATVGSRFYDATAWSLGNTLSPVQDFQSFLYPFDSTPAFDFLLPAPPPERSPNCWVYGGGSIGTSPADAKLALLVHGSLRGQIGYRDKSAGVDFRSSTFTTVTCTGSTATMTGTGYEGDDRVTFTAKAVDGSPDTFSLTLGSPSGYSRSGPLTKGSLTVRG
jgi:hypothetical protein